MYTSSITQYLHVGNVWATYLVALGCLWYYTHVKNKYVDASGVGIASMTRQVLYNNVDISTIVII